MNFLVPRFCVLWLFIFLQLPSVGQASSVPDASVIVLDSSKVPFTQDFSQNLATQIRLRNSSHNLVRLSTQTSPTIPPADLLVAIGHDALVYALDSQYEGSIVTALVSPSRMSTTTAQYPDAKYQQLMGIYYQSSLIRQMILFREIQPNGQSVGLLISPQEEEMIKILQGYAYRLKLTLEYEVVGSKEMLSRKLLRLINKSDVIIATDNEKIYNRTTIKSILLTLYRHNMFLLGADLKFIKPGSVATTYTTIQQLLDEIVDEVNYFSNNNQRLRNSRFSNRFKVSINERVARSLNLSVKKEDYYINAIRAAEIQAGQVVHSE